MRTLHHLPLSPQCRLVRLALSEKRLPFDLAIERVWEQREDFLNLNPAGEVPVLVEENGLAIPGGRVICEYLDEAYPDVPLMGRTLAERVEVRRLLDWFETRFASEVTQNLLGEKVDKRLHGRGHPDGNALRAGYGCLRFHLDYISWLAETRSWLAGNTISIADFAAAAHLSSLDFIGDITWAKAPAAKEWYARVKSRPCFRGLLSDRMSGIMPPAHYANLDF
ncbi:glutathione S-transferase [Neokomagataea thailandica NBRC 106555]|uniref:Glutathione S-transferase family protein n=2 Tax=Neokomagataea TaxID=1223423 RepID=A0A4Y6V7C8_9PROT|nr:MULTISPECIES: glutathione S-transferase family protein [Neokomagataea]QDH24225.1 glutathione S-transferase family protein [Neokomagataea tanensis]GBR52840.1 glutathione S-transferase [Neokomagataea thailandica NBRC 106555]